MLGVVMDKISVITVVFNDVENIRETIESFFSQTWENKEYIVIDGASTDGTADIIKEYSDRLTYWCSERDNGIYDAMNKGILHATGDWINILNSGDVFTSPDSLEMVMAAMEGGKGVDVVYGNCIEEDGVVRRYVNAIEDIRLMEFSPLYRHGASLIRAKIQRKFLYDVSKKDKFGYALDWEMIYRVYKSRYNFRKVDVFIETYKKNGISNRPLLNLWYNYLITSQYGMRLKKMRFFVKAVIVLFLKNSPIYVFLKAFLMVFMVNDILPLIPFWTIRKFYLIILKMRIGKGTFIMKNTYIMNANRIKIGDFSHINRGCVLDARGKIEIGNNVSVSHNVNIMTGSHDIKSSCFIGVFKPIKIEDYAFIGVGATILQGVRIGKGAVVCAGAVVTNDVDDFDIVAGIPAKKIKERTCNPSYHCVWNIPLT